MQDRSFIVSYADIAFRCVLVVAGLLAVPLPSVLLLYAATDLASQYSDDMGPFLWACALFLATGAAYLALVVPAIWRRRFIGARPTVKD